MVRRSISAAVIAVSLLAPPLAAAPPVIAQVTPRAATPGGVTELTLVGQGLQDARRLWTSVVARCEIVPSDEEAVKKGEKLICRVTLPREAQVGLAALRLVTGEGVSSPLLLMVDDLPSLPEAADNHAPDHAQAIQWPAAVDGQSDPVEEDFYRVHADAGQRLSFEVVSQRMGSRLDSVLRLLTVEGRELARSDDAAGSGGDSRLAWVFESSGDYLLALRDVAHGGGGEYRYRLRIGPFPLVTAVYPPGGKGGEVATLETLASGWDACSTLHVALPSATSGPRPTWFSLPAAAQSGSAWFCVEAGPASETLEAEPNDDVAQATAAAVPGAINGRLDKPGDRDCYRLRLSQGQRLRLAAKTRALGSACDLYMSLQRADGSQVATAQQDREALLDFQAPEDGDYILKAEDLLVDGPAGHVYRIDAVVDYAPFSLHAEQTQYQAPQGGTFVVKVLAERRDYNGPIELAASGLDDVKLEGQTFEGGETLLKITLPQHIPPGELRHMVISGTAKIDEQSLVARADQQPALAAMFPNAATLPWPLRQEIAVGVGPPFAKFFELGLAGNDLYFPQLVGEASFDVEIKRINEAFKEPVAIAVEGLPAGLAADVKPVDDGAKTMRISLKGPADLPEGQHAIRIVGTGRFQDQTHVFVLDQARLVVTRPLVLSLSLAGPLAAGGRQQAEVRVQRFGGDPQPVRVRFVEGPAGVAAPIALTLPADADHATIQLSAAAEAPAGKFDNLLAEASTVVQGKPITAEARTTVEIQARPVE